MTSSQHHITFLFRYAAGANFWGSKVQKKFKPPCYDDGLLEVLSIKGVTQMAASKSLPGVSPTRLAQAAHIRITILPGGDVPIQVDGEASTPNHYPTGMLFTLPR